jgi:error-prone DNA polymerase
MAFVHLDVHSNYSLLSGASSVEALVERAAALDMPALALTDTNAMYATVPFVNACRKAGIKPIPGAELACPVGNGTNGGAPPERAVILPKNRRGYSELCRLVTARHLDDTFSLGESLAALSDDLFVLSASEDLLKILAGKKNVYAALPGGSGARARQRRYFLASVADNLGLKTIATNDVHFIEPCQHAAHRILSAIRTRTTVGTLPPGAVVAPSCYLKSEPEMREVFRDFPGSLRAAAEVAWSCTVEFDFDTPRPPRFDPPAGESCYSYLASLAFEGLKRRVGAFSREALQLLTRELDVIERLGMASYFLVCWDIVRFARERGMPSLGRGSAANSMVSYCLGITHVNPMQHNLFFERFLNLERATPPDFDLDFGTSDREQVLEYVFEKYGRDHTAMISTVSTLRARSAVRETAKALGIPESEIDRVVKRIPHFADAEGLEEKLAGRPDTMNLPLRDEPFKTLLGIARAIAGFPRHLATHPCGLVIAPEPVSDLMPLQRGDKGLEITQWTMYPVEDAGLIKIDIIGQKGMAVIKDTIRAVEKNYAVTVAAEEIDYLNDAKGKALMRAGNTEGAFYIESPIMQQLLRQAQCDDFEVLTALSSIIRPGVSNYGGKQQYLDRYLGNAPVTYLHPCLENVLSDTFGCLIYQEQVIQTAVSMAGMTLAEADGLRLCMSKKRNWERMETYRGRFFEGARERGVTEEVIEEVFSQIESFAGYAFCKAHSASFALESFQSVYWRAHYPAEFMAAVLTNQGGYYSTMEYIEEARRMGLAIRPPCINGSGVSYTGRGREVRIGLMQVKGLRSEVMERVVGEREMNGEYRSVDDFVSRVELNRAETESLARCGALDSLGGSRPEILWQVALSLAGPNRDSAGMESRGGAFERDARQMVTELPLLSDVSFEERLQCELDYLGIGVSAHPFALYRSELDRVRRLRPVIDTVEAGDYDGRRIYCLGWKVTLKKVRTSTDGRMMAFVTFSDDRGRVETTFFPEAYERCAEELQKGPGPFLILGTVECSMAAPNLIVERLLLLGRVRALPGSGCDSMPDSVD